MTVTSLPATLQKLIDARLDNVERALIMNGMSRSDRRQIISAIEDQTMEMIARLDDEPTRDDVLRILASLDPPESYLEISQDDVVERMPRIRNTSAYINSTVAPNERKHNVLAIVGFIFACMSVLSSFVWWILDVYGLAMLMILSIPATVCGIIAICQICNMKHHQRGLWMAIVATSTMLPVSLIAFLILYF